MDSGMTGHRALRIVFGVAAVLALVFHATSFVVRTGQTALVTRFGRPQAVVDTAGLHFKAPWPVDVVAPIDMRRRVYETGHTEMLTRDKKNVIVRIYSVWHVADSLLFYQAIGSYEGADTKLDGLLTNAAIGTLGGHDLSAMVSTTASDLKVDAIETELLAATSPLARASYGIDLDQIRLERISLPEENVKAVFDQMRAERKQYAAKFRADGNKEASRIRSEADLQAAQIRAKGAEEEARIRGESAAEVARTYADAHQVDPELYRFTRSLEGIGKLVDGSTTLILRTDSVPFSLLKSEEPVP
jgi:membrane protease subunit HflC